MGIIDLHLHTNNSDGEYSPSKIVDLAAEAQLILMSITDHDTVNGIKEGAEAASSKNIDFIPGIEISTRSATEQHILGYYIDIENEQLKKMCNYFLELRQERMESILKFLVAQGVPLSREQVKEMAPGEYVGRPHIAAAMIKAGYVGDTQEAFSRYLASEDYFKIERPKPSVEEGIETIRAAGGVAVLAHPHSLRMNGKNLDRTIAKLKEIGLEGLECLYGAYDPDHSKVYKRLAEKYDLVMTGGSDYHGENVKSNVKIGSGQDNRLDYNDISVAEKLRARAKGIE